MEVHKFKGDPEEYIEKCLNCRKDECSNCLEFSFRVRTKRSNLIERNKRIMEMFYEGLSGKEIADEFRLDQSTVNGIIKANGGRQR